MSEFLRDKSRDAPTRFESNSDLDKDPILNFLHPQASSTPHKMQYKANDATTKFPEKMAGIAPVAIGTRGTVGSLVRKEIEYFRKLQIDQYGSSQKPQGQVVDMASTGGHFRPSFRFLTMIWKRKKRRGSSGIVPSMCSAVEVAQSNRLNKIPGYSYRILKDDLHV